MPISQIPGEVLVPKGTIAFGDFSAILGRQTQPAFVWSDFMGGTSPDFILQGDNFRLDKIANVGHAPEFFVPHHQVVSGITAVDGTEYTSARTDMPRVTWVATASSPAWAASTEYSWGDTVSSGGLDYLCVVPHTSGGTFSSTYWLQVDLTKVTAQAFPDPQHQFSWLSYSLKTSEASSVGESLTIGFKASTFTPAGGAATNFDEQGFFLQLSKHTFGGAVSSKPAEVDVVWKIHSPGDSPDEGINCTLRLSQSDNPILIMNGLLLREASQSGNPAANKSSGGVGGGDSNPFVSVVTVGGKMKVMASGMSEPIVVHLDRLLRADITENISGTDWQLATLSRFPKNGTVWHWRNGGNPSGESGWVGNLASTDITDSGDYHIEVTSTADLVNQTVAMLEPRIGAVTLIFRRITHASFALHPVRFRSSWSYRSIQQQLGFTPDVSTPWYYTCYACGDWRHKQGGTSWSHQLYPSSSITVSDGPTIAGTEIHQYELEVSMPTIGTYNGVSFARYTVGIERVDSHIEGIHEYNPPTTLNTTLVQLGTNTSASSLVRSVVSEQVLDVSTLQVTNTLTITLSARGGRFADLIGKIGIAGIGNIGVMFRWGYQHQDTMGYSGTGWFGAGEVGFSRYVGFCNRFEYGGEPLGSIVTLTCPDDFSRVRQYPLTAPPLLDGWNHYRAVYTLLQMAGVPDDRIGFMSMVPSSPADLSVSDPDYSTGGFFLPVGVGANTWTPQNNETTVGSLLGMIQKLVGYVMYCDAYGVYQYEPFLQSTPAGTPKRVFREHIIADSNGAPVQFISPPKIVFSNEQTRNKLALIGIDAYGPGSLDPIAVKREDSASISSPVGSQPINYLGYVSPMIIIDPKFYSYDFAVRAADRIHNFLRLPQIEAYFANHGQSDLYVMDWVVVEGWRSGLTNFPATAADLPLFVVSTRTELSVTDRGYMATTQSAAMYIDPVLAADVSGVLG